jgi:signal transduction histidine kinase
VATSAPPSVARGPLARELAVGFGAVSLVSVVVFVLMLTLISQVSGLVTGMRDEEGAIRHAGEVATAVREEYVQVAQTLLDGDHAHLERYAAARARVREGLAALTPHVPPEDRGRLTEIAAQSQRLADRFAATTLPAVDRGDRAALLAESHALAGLAEDAGRQADALARVVESRMAHAHVLATRATRLGLIGGGIGALAVVALSIGFTIRLRRAVVRPLTALTAAARRFGAGEFDARVGAVGRGELRALSQAFDRMAEELAERQRRLVDQERMAAIGHLAAGVAHELNNPIGIIRGYLKTMTPGDDPRTLAEELQILDEEAAQCQRIAEDLLAYARPLEVKHEPLELRAFLEETVRRFRESPAARDATIRLDAEACALRADPSRLRQVVLNLVLNAVQVSPPGAAVELRGRRDDAGYLLEVTDDGPGIAEEDHGKIFEPFFTKRPGGSGLGLSVCQGIVRAHGGTIEVASHLGGGATFRVRLPTEAAS